MTYSVFRLLPPLVALFLAVACETRPPAATTGGGGADSVGNGGGSVEMHFAFALAHLDEYLALCLGDPTCRLDGAEKIALERIGDALPAERQAPLLRYRSDAAFFLLDGKLRVARTGNVVGSPVEMHLPQIYHPVRLNVGDAVAILVHELGHHQGITDHDWLDRLGAKVQSAVTKIWQRLPNDRGFSAAPAYVAYHLRSSVTSSSQILVDTGVVLLDLTKEVGAISSWVCADRSSAPFVIGNLHWKDDWGDISASGEEYHIDLSLYAPIRFACKTRVLPAMTPTMRIQFNVQIPIWGAKEFAPISVARRQMTHRAGSDPNIIVDLVDTKFRLVRPQDE